MSSKKVPAYFESDGIINIGHHEFHRALAKAKFDDFPDQQRLEGPLDKALWALWVLKDYFRHDDAKNSSVTAREISEILEIRGIALTPLQIHRALARAGDKVHRKKTSGDNSNQTLFKIMEAGKNYLRETYASETINVSVVDGGKPWTARHKTFADLAAQLKGNVCVVDKFYGVATLGTLEHLKHAAGVKFLTAKPTGSPAAFQAELRKFRYEFPALEVRIYPNEAELHDRYILTDDALLVIGHGIKDLGTKESFVLLLKGDISKEIRHTLQAAFDVRWAASAPIA